LVSDNKKELPSSGNLSGANQQHALYASSGNVNLLCDLSASFPDFPGTTSPLKQTLLKRETTITF
jgi:hypothetical protein